MQFHFLIISLPTMKKGNYVKLIVSILLFPMCSLMANVYHTQIFDTDIHTLRVYNPNQKPYYPVVDLHVNEYVELSFDDLHPSFRLFSYKIIHCNADWTVSNATETEYAEGFSTGNIEDSSPSINTYVPYTHHSIRFPNENVRFKQSGNYAIVIYTNNDEQQVALTARVYVSENSITINGTVSGITDIDYKKEHQQLSIDIIPNNFTIHNPYRDIKVIVQQNQRMDNEVSNVVPSIVQGNKISYINERKLIFAAGNEFRNFDLSATRILSRRIEDISFVQTQYHALLYPDEIRKKAWYTQDYDINGRIIVNIQGTTENDTEADYFFVHFSLPSSLLPEDVYLLGQFNHYHMDSSSIMKYNYEKRCYEKSLLLKQGGYDYAYVTRARESEKGTMNTIEGDYWETENEYIVYVYYRSFNDQSDRLIGKKIIRTTN